MRVYTYVRMEIAKSGRIVTLTFGGGVGVTMFRNTF